MKSPCNKICQIDQVTRICLGCHRTLEEIGSWTRYSDAERDAIMAELDKRRVARAAG